MKCHTFCLVTKVHDDNKQYNVKKKEICGNKLIEWNPCFKTIQSCLRYEGFDFSKSFGAMFKHPLIN